MKPLGHHPPRSTGRLAQNSSLLVGILLLSTSSMLCGCGRGSSGRGSEVQTGPPPLPHLKTTYEEVREVIQSRRESVLRHPDSAAAWGAYGMVLDAHEFRDEAITCYETALSLDPRQIRWAYYLSSQVRSRDPEKALEVLNRPMPMLRSSLPVLLLRADLLQELGQEDAAAEVLSTTLEIAPDHPHVRLRRARRYVQQQKFDKARELLTGAEDENVDTLPADSLAARFQDAAQLLAQIEAARGDNLRAQRLQTSSAELPSSQATVVDEFQAELAAVRRDPLWLGERYSTRAAAGDPIALAQLDRIVQSHPDLVPNRIHLALLLSDRNENAAALESIDEGLRTSPENVRLLMAKATILIRLRDWQRAADVLQGVTRAAPASAAAWADLGFVQEQLGLKEAAMTSLKQSLRLNGTDKELQERLDRLEQSTHPAP